MNTLEECLRQGPSALNVRGSNRLRAILVIEYAGSATLTGNLLVKLDIVVACKFRSIKAQLNNETLPTM